MSGIYLTQDGGIVTDNPTVLAMLDRQRQRELFWEAKIDQALAEGEAKRQERLAVEARQNNPVRRLFNLFRG